MYADNLRHTGAIVNEILQHLTEFHTEFLLSTAQMFPFYFLHSELPQSSCTCDSVLEGVIKIYVWLQFIYVASAWGKDDLGNLNIDVWTVPGYDEIQ